MPSPLTAQSSDNFAPLQPLLALGQDNPKPVDYLWTALAERFRHCLMIEDKVWREMLLSGQQNANFIEGKQFLMPDPWRVGKFIPYEMPNYNAQKRALNITQFYVSNCLFKWLLSNPDVKVGPAIDTDESEQAAKGAAVIVDRYEGEFYTPRRVIKEGLQGICWGSYIWRLYPDVGKPIAMAIREVLGEKEIELGQGFGQCGDCGYSGTANDFPEVSGDGYSMNVCPQCDSQVQVERARGMVPTVVDQQQVPIFDLSAEIVPFTNVRWNLQYSFDESDFAIIRKRVSLGLIKSMFGNIRVPAGNALSDIGLDIAERLAYSGSANAGYSMAGTPSKASLYREPCTIEEFWMDASYYSDIIVPADVQTVSGQTIPAGPLTQTFPDRMLVQGLNELSTIAGIFREAHKDYTVQGSWYSKPMSGAGRGLNDLIEVNKILNSDHAQVHNYLKSVSTPAMLYRAGAIGDENRAMYLGHPTKNFPIQDANLPDDMRLSDIVAPAFQPQSVPGQMFDFTYNRTNELAQIMSHVTDFSAGLPGVNNRTATGARITQANSNALFTPPLQIKGEIRQFIAEKTVKLYCKHIPVERYFPLKGKFGRMQGVYLAGAMIHPEMLAYNVEEGSELPVNSEIKREDYAAFFAAFGPQGFVAYQQAKAAYPEMVQDVERAFGVKADAEKYNVAETVCLGRVKQMSQFAQMTQDPQALLMAIQPPVEPLEKNVEQKIDWLQEWFDSDDGQEAPLQLRAAVGLLIQLHFQNLSAMQTTIAGAAGQAQQAALPPQPPPPEEPPPQETPDNQAKIQDNKDQRAHDAKQAELDRQHEKDLMKMKPKGKAA